MPIPTAVQTDVAVDANVAVNVADIVSVNVAVGLVTASVADLAAIVTDDDSVTVAAKTYCRIGSTKRLVFIQ